MVYGGRSSPLSPTRGLFKVLLDPAGPPAPPDGVKLCVEELLCTGDPPPPRWRHTAAIVSHKGTVRVKAFFSSSERAMNSR